MSICGVRIAYDDDLDQLAGILGRLPIPPSGGDSQPTPRTDEQQWTREPARSAARFATPPAVRLCAPHSGPGAGAVGCGPTG